MVLQAVTSNYHNINFLQLFHRWVIKISIHCCFNTRSVYFDTLKKQHVTIWRHYCTNPSTKFPLNIFSFKSKTFAFFRVFVMLTSFTVKYFSFAYFSYFYFPSPSTTHITNAFAFIAPMDFKTGMTKNTTTILTINLVGSSATNQLKNFNSMWYECTQTMRGECTESLWMRSYWASWTNSAWH